MAGLTAGVIWALQWRALYIWSHPVIQYQAMCICVCVVQMDLELRSSPTTKICALFSLYSDAWIFRSLRIKALNCHSHQNEKQTNKQNFYYYYYYTEVTVDIQNDESWENPLS